MALLSSAPAWPTEPGFVSRALDVAAHLADEAGDVLSATAGRATRPDGGGDSPFDGGGDSPFDWVRDTHAILDRHTRRVLAAEFPGIPVLGPGSRPGDLGATPYRWLVAPLDGRANYVTGLPWYAYSLALMDPSGPVVGVVTDPGGGTTYAAARGRGLRTQEGPVRPHRCRDTEGAIVCVEPDSDPLWSGLATFAERARAARASVRVLGSATLSVTQVALGRAAAAILPRYREAEVAGALALAVEAAAVVIEDAIGLPDGALVLCAPAVVGEVLSWLRD